MEVIETYTDNNGRTYEICYFRSLRENEYVYQWFLKNCQELVDSGHALKAWNFGDIEYEGIVAFYENKPVGQNVARPDPEEKILAESFQYVEPDHRGQGLGDRMLKALSRQGLKNGYRATTGFVHHNNFSTLSYNLSRGYKILPFYTVAYVFEDRDQ